MKLKSWFNIGVLVSILGFAIVLLLIISNGFKLFVSDTFNKSYEIEESFDSIKLDLNEADINIYYSEDGKNIVKTQEKKHQTFDAKVVNGVLVIEEKFPFDKEEHKRWLYTAATRAAEKLVVINK